ncbi:glycoside hydrolase family 31 protein [Pontibacillus litoralis]|uniref:Alpha-glucosidase n=1 Tax=Pontibacillus litoralis JSM 072002 TaxID=1385512 RepID=A0A0A5HVV8_9BACI|nr:TIM-barrel domain-containing protein [Pontibacillus litoralis]KGX87777.1 alpha-glucosidase [Pontibacillus litoralis JSM 072002]
MLDDTSFAIHPGNESKVFETSFHDIGRMVQYKQKEEGLCITGERGYVTLQVYRDDIIRITMNAKDVPTCQSTPAVVATKQHIAIEVEDLGDWLTFATKMMHVIIHKDPLRITVKDQEGRTIVSEQKYGMAYKANGEVICYKERTERDHFYGFGEKSGFLDKRGETYTMWNTDVYAPHNPETDALYQSIPYFMVLRDGKAHGIFLDNSYKTTFNMKSNEQYSFKADGGELDYYVMAGPSPKQVLEQYTYITGKMPLPPKWALGYHQSRYSYQSEQEVRELVNTFLTKQIPVDVIYLDIHYMDEYRVFTFDPERFPNPKQLIQELKERGIRIVPIVDPGVKKDAEYEVYQQGIYGDYFCKYIEGDIYIGDVWPGESAFPDFTDEATRKWWGSLHKFYTDLGIEGIWNDMNEPAVFNEAKTMDTSVMHKNDGNPATHRALHNVYGLLMGKATHEGMKEHLEGKRPFLLTRAGFAGVQRYGTVWTGDNRSFWEHLQMSLPMCMNLGLSGVPFTGPDVGGFAHDTNGELLTRWTQVGAFTPYFRNHSALGFHYQEPWQFGEREEAIIKRYIQMRYEWMPQLYTLFQQASLTGLPVMRPLLLEYPEDEKTYNLNDQFMIGDNVVIAPVMQPSVTDRAVYFPEGEWVDYFTNKAYEGDKMHLIHAELDTLPIFIRKGTFVALSSSRPSTMTAQTDLTLHIYANTSGVYENTLYDDDGETYQYESGNYMQMPVKVTCNDDNVEVTIGKKVGKYVPAYENLSVVVHGLADSQTFTVNGERKSTITMES